jgi:hypothetical protein
LIFSSSKVVVPCFPLVVAYSLDDINAPLYSAGVEVDLVGHDDGDDMCRLLLLLVLVLLVLAADAYKTRELTSFVLNL